LCVSKGRSIACIFASHARAASPAIATRAA
jgi:hypothetical protein